MSLNNGADRFMDIMCELLWFLVAFVIAPGLILLLLFCLFGVIIEWIYPPTTVALELNKWHCTSEFQERRFNGKVWYYVTSCAEYQRRDEK